jgi:hypothetical protein
MNSVSKMVALAIIAFGMTPLNAHTAEPIRELKEVPALELEKPARQGRPEIHRIKTRSAFKKLGGNDDFEFDFDSHDLVIVRGSLGCAHGSVQVKDDDMTATFSVRITSRCTHRTRILHHFAYASAFAITNETTTADTVFTAENKSPEKATDLDQKLGKTDATHLNLSSCGVTDSDMSKLKSFKDLTHLYLNSNQITDKGLANLSHLTELYQLYLGDNPEVTDDGLAHLKDIMTSRLQILGIDGTHITADGLEQLQQWSGQQKNSFSTQIHHSIVTPVVYE